MGLDSLTEAWQFIVAVGGVLGGAVVWVINKFYGAKRARIDYKQHETQLVNSITAQWKGTFESQQEQIDKLNAEVSDLRTLEKKYHAENLELKEHVSRLTTQLETSNAGFMHLPVPQWTLNQSWQFFQVNKYYTAEFLEPRGLNTDNIVGVPLADHFPPEIVEAIQTHSKEAKNTERVVIEPIVMTNGAGVREVWVFIFYFFKVGYFPVAHAGAAIPIDVNTVGPVLEQLKELP